MKTRNDPARPVATSAFLALPTEIRHIVYGLVLISPLLSLQETRRSERERTAARFRMRPDQSVSEVIDTTQSLASSTKCPAPLLRVCRQIYDEAFPFFYNYATLSVEKPLDFANTFLLRLGSAKVSELRNIRFKIGTLTPPFENAVHHLNSLKFN